MQINKFLKIIKKRLDNYKNSNNNCPKLNEVIFELDELVNIAETQISQSNNGWKSVQKHGLPKESGKYLVYSCVKENAWLSNFDDYCGFNFHHEQVTHYIKIQFPNFGE